MKAFQPLSLARTAVAAALLLWSAGAASAQVADAVLEVIVSDESGAPLPGASVRATRSDTGLDRQAVSDGVGVARLPALPPGVYQVRVELPGIPPVTEENVTLRIGQTARVKVTLTMRQAEAVTVSAAVPVVDEIASAELDKQAREEGFTKFEPNLAGC